jgi:pyruvate dehydrogenase (quinone)
MVLNNGDLNQVTWEQRVMEGDPRYDASQHVPDFPYARYAELCGLKGIMVNKPEQIGAAWDEALGSDVPTLVEVMADPDVPPLPPHITGKQGREFLKALAKGDADSVDIVKSSAKEWWDALFPPKARK